MADQIGTFERLIREFGILLRPLESALTAEELRALLFTDLGATAQAGALEGPAFQNAFGQIAIAAAQLPEAIAALGAAFEDGDVSGAVQAASQLLQQIQATIAALDAIGDELQNASNTLLSVSQEQVRQFAQALTARLIELLAIYYLDTYIVRKEWLILLGIVTRELIPVNPSNADEGFFVREELHARRILDLLRSPAAYAGTVYNWGEPSFQGQAFLERLTQSLTVSHIPAELTPAAPGSTPVLEALLFTLRQDGDGTPGLRLDLKLPIAAGADIALPVSPAYTVHLTSSGQFDPGLQVLARPPADLSLLPPGNALSGTVNASFAGKNPDPTQPFVLLGQSGGSRIEASEFQLRVGLAATASGTQAARGSFLAEAIITGGKAVLDASSGDSFLSAFLPDKPIEADLDLGASWTPTGGLRFKGSGGLEISIPVYLSFGPLTLQGLYLSSRLDTDSGSVPLEVSSTLSGELGPVTVTVDRLGLEAQLGFPDGTGNLGPIDFSIGYKPPNGLGLAIDAQAAIGGGYLRFDPQKAEYSGVLDLQIAEKIAVKGIGLLTTRLPDGAAGYSLVVIISAEDFTPIQLGLGFSLTGIGGLLAINRTFDESALRAGLKNHILDSVLFPHDPIRNAPQILSNLNKVFPPARGHHLFGPIVQIAWGTPPLITADLALVLEVGARLRLLILAQVLAVLPTRDNDLLRLQMDAVGVVDFDQGTAALDATLHDSRLLRKFVLTGDMAMRLQWEGSRNFALAVGGLHPAFNPPPNFPKLDRLAINLTSGDNPRIRCEAYFAITANTRQFGARAELYAAAGGFSIQGEISYDVLFQVDPFAFAADFLAQLQLKHGTTNLFKVKVEGELAGPRPLHIKAKATFEILWWDVSVRVDKTLVEGDRPPSLPPVDVMPQLKAALQDPANWNGQLPDGQRPVVTFRATAGTATEVLLHPLGTLTVKQGVVPLNLDISRFGEGAPAGAHRFTITSATIGGDGRTTQPVKDFFAPAQFLNMSDDEKLSRPSFEPMTAGVSFGSDEFAIADDSGDWLEVPSIDFETIVMDKQANTSRPSSMDGPYQLSVVNLGTQARFGAAGASDLRHTGRAKYRTTAGKYQIAREGWSIVATADLAVQPLPGAEARTPVSYSEAAQALQTLEQTQQARGSLQILRLSEVQNRSND
jgi:hypothetical protein